MKIKKVNSFDNKFWLKVKLVLVPMPFLVSELEQSKIGDLTLFPNIINEQVEWNSLNANMLIPALQDYIVNGLYNLKVISLPNNFPKDLLDKIKNEEIENGSDLLIECEEILGDEGIFAVLFGEDEYRVKYVDGKFNYKIQ